MSNQEQETEVENGAHEAASDGAQGELILNVTLSPKTLEFGDGGDISSAAESSLQDTLTMKTEMDDNASAKSSNSRNKSASPSSKRSSKRKRKNRRRREKKAAASGEVTMLDTTCLSSGIDDGTGTETEFSQNSEDVRKGEETGTESETTCIEVELNQNTSSMCVEQSPTSSSIPVDKVSHSMLGTRSSFEFENKGTEDEVAGAILSKGGPTHSVETLLQIAKCKIMSQILEPLHEADYFATSGTQSESQDNSSSKLIVPPCSPSSIHSISNIENLEGLCSVRGVQGGVHKPAAKNVHFDIKPPEVVTGENCLSKGTIFENVADTTERYEDKPTSTSFTSSKNTSKEAVVLVGNVGHTGSATSSIASENSAASLLKGNGSSSDDFTSETNQHYPSRETVDESTSEINMDGFAETIQIFKLQNPMETQYIGNEVDSILTKSLNKFTTLMGKTSECHVSADDIPAPVFSAKEMNSSARACEGPKKMSSRNSTNSDSANSGIQNLENLTLPQIEKVSSSEYSGKTLHSYKPLAENEIQVESIDSMREDSDNLNATFTVDRVPDEYDQYSILRPLSPGEVMTQAIPDTVSDTDSVTTAGCLSIVQEEDENEEDDASLTNSAYLKEEKVCSNVSSKENIQKISAPSLFQAASTASCCTVIETTVSVHRMPDALRSANENTFETNAPVQVLSRDQPSIVVTTPSNVGVEAPKPVEVFSPSRPHLCDVDPSSECIEPNKSVEVLTLHLPDATSALPSENNFVTGNGDQPCVGNNNSTGHFITAPDKPGISFPQERNVETFTGRDTETDSDYPWLPERKNSLKQVILGKKATEGIQPIKNCGRIAESGAARNDPLAMAGQQPNHNAEEEGDERSQGCNCAKMCVIT